VLEELLSLRDPLRARGDDEARVPTRLQLRVDDRRHHMDVGDPAVGGPGLGPGQHPLVGLLVVDGPGAHRSDVGTGVGLRGTERDDLRLLDGAEHGRNPLADPLVGAVGPHGRRREGGADDGQPDAGVTPEEFLHGERDAEGGLVEPLGGEEVEGVQPDLGGLLQDLPREVLPLVVLRGRGARDVLGLPVHPLLQLELVLGEVERHGHGGVSF
jgi:hypothetical protein